MEKKLSIEFPEIIRELLSGYAKDDLIDKFKALLEAGLKVDALVITLMYNHFDSGECRAKNYAEHTSMLEMLTDKSLNYDASAQKAFINLMGDELEDAVSDYELWHLLTIDKEGLECRRIAAEILMKHERYAELEAGEFAVELAYLSQWEAFARIVRKKHRHNFINSLLMEALFGKNHSYDDSVWDKAAAEEQWELLVEFDEWKTIGRAGNFKLLEEYKQWWYLRNCGQFDILAKNDQWEDMRGYAPAYEYLAENNRWDLIMYGDFGRGHGNVDGCRFAADKGRWDILKKMRSKAARNILSANGKLPWNWWFMSW